MINFLKQFYRSKKPILKLLLFVLLFYYMGKMFPLITNIILGVFGVMLLFTIGMIVYHRYIKDNTVSEEEMQDKADSLLAEVDLEDQS